jgi:hypothetical protein
MATEPDKYDSYAEIAGGVSGIPANAWPGLAHIFRQIARDERKACVQEVLACRVSDNGAYLQHNRACQIIASKLSKPLNDEDAVDEDNG